MNKFVRVYNVDNRWFPYHTGFRVLSIIIIVYDVYRGCLPFLSTHMLIIWDINIVLKPNHTNYI